MKGEMVFIQTSTTAPLGIEEPASHEHDSHEKTEKQQGAKGSMVYAGLEVSPGDSGNTEEALVSVSRGRRGLLEGVTSQLRSEGEVRFSQVKKVRQVFQA